MALLSDDLDSDLIRLWGLVAELSEQLNANRALTSALQAQAAQAKGQVYHTGTGFILRRFNVDLSKEVFESEVERLNASLSIENQSLLYENKQLNLLLKEYEQTLESVMAKFRAQSHAAQQHELDLTRHYESLLLSRETNTLNQDLLVTSSQSDSLGRLSHYIRSALRSLAGEADPEGLNKTSNEDGSPEVEEGEDGPNLAGVLAQLSNRSSSPAIKRPASVASSSRPRPEDRPDYREGGYAGETPPLEDWALEREIEINRLEKENEELRRLLSIHEGMMDMAKDVPPSYWGTGLGGVDGTSVLLSSPAGSTSSLGGESWKGSGLGLSKYGGPLRQGLLAQNRAKIMLASTMGGAGVGGPGSRLSGDGVGSLLGIGGAGGPPTGFGNLNMNGVGIHHPGYPSANNVASMNGTTTVPGAGSGIILTNGHTNGVGSGGGGPFQPLLQLQQQQNQIQSQAKAQSSPFTLIQISQAGPGSVQQQQQTPLTNRNGELSRLWANDIDSRGGPGYFKEFPT